MTEKQLQDYFINKAKTANFLCHKVESKSSRGFPDLILISDGGRVDFVELKNPSGKGRLSPHQVRLLGELRDLDCNVHLIYTVDQTDALFKRLAA